MTAHLLVVDDQPAVREILAAMLDQAGYTVRQASNGSEAMRAMGHESFDLVLLDVHLPGNSGWDILQQVRRVSPEQRVVMISDERHQEEAQERGADGFLAKPYRRSVLEDTVQVVLSHPR